MERSSAFGTVKQKLNNAQDPVKAIVALQEENQHLQKQLQQLLKEKAGGLKNELRDQVEQVGDVNLVARQVDLDAGGMKDLAFELANELDRMVLLLGADQDGKALLTCYISKELVEEKKWNAGQMIRDLAKHIQGGGGGQPFFATAGGKNPAGIKAALAEVRALLS